MKIILRVAKTELRTLFYSPIAWFLMIVFLIQCGIVYLGQLESAARQQDLGGMELMHMNAITERIFLSQRGLFGTIMQNLYLYVPLLTMSLISREINNGTIKLLYSSPIKVREIILGKYLSMMVFSLVLVAVVALFLCSGMFQIEHPETGMLLTALLGLYLLLCAYSAIGLFMSCLSTYQVVAAISTFVMIGILSYIGTLWQRIEFVRELTYFLSINGRTQKMLAGLLTTKDVIYFLVIVYIFLGLSIYKVRGGMESKPLLVRVSRYAGVLASALLIGYISSIPSLIGYYDATFNKSRTITPQVQKIVADFGDEPLEITAYNNLLGKYFNYGGPESYNQNLARWEPYIRFKNNIVLKNVNYYDSVMDNEYLMRSHRDKSLKEIAEQYAKNYEVKLSDFKSPEEIRSIIDLNPELNRYVMQLKWKGRTTYLRVFDDMRSWPGETEIAAAFKRLQQAAIPKIGFISGNLERDIKKMGDKDYKMITNLSTFRYSLLNQGFDVVPIALDAEEIPTDIASLVLADPKIELSATAMTKLQAYIDRGGNLLIAGEPGRQSILNPLLQQFGVQFMPGTIIQESKELAPDLAVTALTSVAGGFSKPVEKSRGDSVKVAMPGALALTYESNGAYQIKDLLLTDSTLSWNRMQRLDLDLVTNAAAGNNNIASITGGIAVNRSGSNKDAKPVGTVRFSPEEGDIRGPLPTAVALSRTVGSKEQRVVILGDADLMSNAELGRFNIQTANFEFNTSLFSWLSYGEFPVDAFRPDARDKRVKVTPDQVDFLRIIYVWVLPAILLGCGMILLVRRKRK